MYYEIQLEIEKACFLDCLHCSSLETRTIKNLNYTIDDITNFLGLFDNNITLYLTGGEPLISNNLKPILNKLKNFNNVNPGIFTCGIFSHNLNEINFSDKFENDYLKTLKNCYISIYSLIPEEHDKITNLENSLVTTLKSIQNLIEIGVDVKIHLVINKFNINKIEETITNLAKLGVSEVRILKLVKNGNATNNWDIIGVDDDIQDLVIKDIFLKKDSYNIKVTFSGFPEMIGCRPFKDSIGCQAGCKLLYITIDGDVFPCACTKSMPKYKIGKITELNKIQSYLTNIKKIQYYEKCLKNL
ncbi:radical SAM/SPASM domain-containing protein [Cetobacterium sp.]|uniref:radical SAM protein n=1 Tax=Cetobacterium sp. TaxID=2071632 RepID=UPI003F378D52